MSAPKFLREIVVFLPDDHPDEYTPMDAAHALISALGVEHAAFGLDVLTGSVEVRMPHDAGLVRATRKSLTEQNISFEIEVR